MWPFAPAYPTVFVEDAGSQVASLEDDSVGRGVYDYIIVGGGTSGCALASRLSEDPSIRVLLVERGGPDTSWNARVPLTSLNYADKDINIPSVPLKSMDNQILDVIMADGLGGGSSINAMLYTRGAPAEYNRWNDTGRKGWSYDDVKPYFIKSENTLSQPASNYHGKSGPWQTRLLSRIYLDSVTKCADAAQSLGLPIVEDINSPDAPAVACAKLHVTIDKNSRRCSSFAAFLPYELALERKKQLHICTNAVVTSLDIKSHQEGGLRATGIFFQTSKSSETFYARARREVVLCAGAFGSPKILMLSGIGPEEHLKGKGIEVKKNLPGVGSNLQDHFGISTMYRIPVEDSLHILQTRPLRAIRELLNYILWGDGLFLAPVTQISLFARSLLLGEDSSSSGNDPSELDASKPENIPDIEIMPIPHKSVDYDVDLSDGRGVFSFLGVLLQPRSTGTVRLASSNAKVPPVIDLGFLTDPADYSVLRKIAKLSKKLAEKMRGQGYPMADLLVPDSMADHDLDAFIRKTGRTTYHYSSTCRMAPEDDPRPGVVDDELKVHGVLGLRIADCSILPDIIASHLQAPAVMVGEKCADMMKTAAKTHR